LPDVLDIRRVWGRNEAMPTPRVPDLFLNSLADAFFTCTANDGPESTSVRNAHFFYAAKSASIARLIELDRIIPEFEKLSNEGRTLERMFEENRLLYGFFTNALSAIESFCFAAYFLGTALKKSDFEPEPKLWRTNPEKTLRCFRNLYSNSPFTKALLRCIWSEQYATVSAVRNMLSHRFSPGRVIRPMVNIHSWNLDMWFAGNWRYAGGGVSIPLPKKEFQIETKSLIDLRDWMDEQLELLGKKLQNLAVSKGLSK
jgi:hypothetical protein